MKYVLVKLTTDHSRSIFFSACIAIVTILCAIFTSSALHAANQEMGSVTGDITVLSKKFFGGLKKKKDLSKTVVYITGFKTGAHWSLHRSLSNPKATVTRLECLAKRRHPLHQSGQTKSRWRCPSRPDYCIHGYHRFTGDYLTSGNPATPP